MVVERPKGSNHIWNPNQPYNLGGDDSGGAAEGGSPTVVVAAEDRLHNGKAY